MTDRYAILEHARLFDPAERPDRAFGMMRRRPQRLDITSC